MPITFSALSFSWPDGTPVLHGVTTTIGAGRTGLVAPNGAGKSTLLRLVTGELTPDSGSVTVDGVLGYLPQDLPFAAAATVADVLGVADVLAAIAAVESGDADALDAVGTDWDVEERATAVLGRLGLADVALDRGLTTLSGGQVVTLGLAGQLLRRPDVLLLDEPTNNLDGDARARLYDVVDGWTGTLVVASHDRELVERVDHIVELDGGGLRTTAGPFSAWEEAVAVEQAAVAREVQTAEQALRREEREKQEARERAERRAGNAARRDPDAGIPKILLGARKRRAQASAGRADGNRVDRARDRLGRAEQGLRADQRIELDLPGTEVPAGRTVVEAVGVRVRELFSDGLDLELRGPERVALTGPNGSGKSTLLRVLAGDLVPDAGTVRRAEGRVAYLSQRLDLLDPAMSVADCLAAAAPERPDAERRTLLARFLFRGDRAALPVGALSGGERLRATLAATLFAEPAPQLLLLDEPTNNLDLVGVGQLESALAGYRGALVAVSHDQRFLAALGPDRWVELSPGGSSAGPRTSSGAPPAPARPRS